jgi:hypothetical protein
LLRIFFLDTCTLLDIVWAPLRDQTATVRAGVELRTLVPDGPVRLFVQDIMHVEWAVNLPAGRRDGEADVRAFTATWQIADLGQPTPPLPVLPLGTLIDELERLSHDLLMAADTLDRDHAGMSWAIDRVAAKQKSSAEKGTVKDGQILRLSTLLATAEYPHSRVLFSSNRSDFAALISDN